MTDPFYRFAAWAVAAGFIGLGVAAAVGRAPEERNAAVLGVALAVASTGMALFLKRRALKGSTPGAVQSMGVVFAIRFFLAGFGLVGVAVLGLGKMSFVIGFFATYFVLQWLEVGYVLAEKKRLGHGG